jgi:hypothetical protein
VAPVPLFVNDLTYPLRFANQQELSEIVLKFLSSIKKVKELSRGLIVGSRVPLSNIKITDDYRTLSSLANIVNKEWWRFIKGLDQHSPFINLPACVKPPAAQHLVPVCDSVSPLWANANEGFLVSFEVDECWLEALVQIEVCDCALGEHAPYNIHCKNISRIDHVLHWERGLKDFSLPIAASSFIYRCATFSLRMFLNDHLPAHAHVYVPRRPGDWLAKIRLDEVEFLRDDGLTGRERRSIEEFVRANRGDLLVAWERCRDGLLPNEIR